MSMEEQAKKIAELLRLLANENRLLILCAFIESPLTVTELAKFLPAITQSALSQHLLLLKTAGLLDSKKSGQHVTYAIADERINIVIQTLKQQYCDI